MSLTDKLSEKISTELNYDSEKSAVISYGIFAVLQILASLALITLLGLLFGIVLEALIVSFSISILRQYSGGVHATRPSICLIIGTIATVALAVISHYLIHAIDNTTIIVFANFVFIALTYFYVIKYAPVDSQEKPIKTLDKRKRMKKLSLIVLSVYLLIIILLVILATVHNKSVYLEYSLCISLATLWQCFNLTKKGHRLLRKVDSVIKKILFRTKEDV